MRLHAILHCETIFFNTASEKKDPWEDKDLNALLSHYLATADWTSIAPEGRVKIKQRGNAANWLYSDLKDISDYLKLAYKN